MDRVLVKVVTPKCRYIMGEPDFGLADLVIAFYYEKDQLLISIVDSFKDKSVLSAHQKELLLESNDLMVWDILSTPFRASLRLCSLVAGSFSLSWTTDKKPSISSR